MKNLKLNRFLTLLILAVILFVSSCADLWDEHYNEDSFNLVKESLNENIQERSELSTFLALLRKTGYDQVLNASQSYTVWAPNNDALAEIDTTDADLALEIVKNHIARSRFTTSGIDDKAILMLNGKFNYFTSISSGYTFGKQFITEENIPAVNGLLHIIDGYAPYIGNLWEFIGRADGLDSLSSYIYGESKDVFDPYLSTELGVDSLGNVYYDSTFVPSNKILEEIGAIDQEDSVYTAIFPDNTAWTEAYGRIEGFFNFPEDAGAAIRQREYTQFTIVQDMLFRGYITNPGAYPSLTSTIGNEFINPASLFLDANMDSLSNGISYITSQMPYTSTDSWFKEIRVEAEEEEGRTNQKNILFERTSYGSNLPVSNDRYILLDPTSNDSYARFTIPNTLSGTYNIYCVFVPANIVDPANLTPSKVKFELTRISRSSGSVATIPIEPEANTTFPYGLTKMLVDQYTFQYANVSDEEYPRVAVGLKVLNAATTEEEQQGLFTRTMRIDCIILEPVTE